MESLASAAGQAMDPVYALKACLNTEADTLTLAQDSVVRIQGEVESREHLGPELRQPEITGDRILASALGSMVDDNAPSGCWIQVAFVSNLAHVVLENPGESVGALFRRAVMDNEVAEAVLESLEGPLFRFEVSMEDLLQVPWVERLDGLSAVAFVLGYSRMISLSSDLNGGLPPETHYAEDERSLYFELEEADVRRTARLWFELSFFADGARDWNDRADALTRLWSLNPVPAAVREYLRMIYRSFIAGHTGECVILCRSVLERTLEEAFSSLSVDRPETMAKQIKRLNALGRLSGAGSSRAFQVLQRGNKVIHGHPNLVEDALPTIEATLSVMKELATDTPRQ